MFPCLSLEIKGAHYFRPLLVRVRRHVRPIKFTLPSVRHPATLPVPGVWESVHHAGLAEEPQQNTHGRHLVLSLRQTAGHSQQSEQAHQVWTQLELELRWRVCKWFWCDEWGSWGLIVNKEFMLTANHFQDLILMMATLQSTSVISARRSSIIQNLSPATGSTTLATPRVSTASISSPRWGHSTVTSGRSTRRSRARGLSGSSRTQSWTSLSVSRYFTILSDKIYISLFCPIYYFLSVW